MVWIAFSREQRSQLVAQKPRLKLYALLDRRQCQDGSARVNTYHPPAPRRGVGYKTGRKLGSPGQGSAKADPSEFTDFLRSEKCLSWVKYLVMASHKKRDTKANVGSRSKAAVLTAAFDPESIRGQKEG
jgi:hypothetical protein